MNLECSLEGLMLKLKFQYFGHLMWRADSVEKTPMLGIIEEKWMTEDEMVVWHHWLNGHEFEQTQGDNDGQRSLVCCSSWGPKESDTLSDWTTTMLSMWVSLVAQTVKTLPAVQKTWVQSPGQEDPLEKGMTTHFSFLAWRIPWTKEPCGL